MCYLTYSIFSKEKLNYEKFLLILYLLILLKNYSYAQQVTIVGCDGIESYTDQSIEQLECTRWLCEVYDENGKYYTTFRGDSYYKLEKQVVYWKWIYKQLSNYWGSHEDQYTFKYPICESCNQKKMTDEETLRDISKNDKIKFAKMIVDKNFETYIDKVNDLISLRDYVAKKINKDLEIDFYPGDIMKEYADHLKEACDNLIKLKNKLELLTNTNQTDLFKEINKLVSESQVEIQKTDKSFLKIPQVYRDAMKSKNYSILQKKPGTNDSKDKSIGQYFMKISTGTFENTLYLDPPGGVYNDKSQTYWEIYADFKNKDESARIESANISFFTNFDDWNNYEVDHTIENGKVKYSYFF